MFLIVYIYKPFVSSQFFSVQGFALLVTKFSIMNGNRLAREVSSTDSILMSLGNSILVFISESESERFHLFCFYLNLPCDFFHWSLCSITHHGVQLLMRIYQGCQTHSSSLRQGYINQYTLTVRRL